MPTISSFYGIIVQMYWRDHNPPHFHVRYAGSLATIDIRALVILSGELPRNAERLVLEWAEKHQAELLENWRLCQLKIPPLTVEPLP